MNFKTVVVIIGVFAVAFLDRNESSITLFKEKTFIVDEYGDNTSVLYDGATVNVVCMLEAPGDIELVHGDAVLSATSFSSDHAVLSFKVGSKMQFGSYKCREKSSGKISAHSVDIKYRLCPDSSKVCQDGQQCLEKFTFCMARQNESEVCGIFTSKDNEGFPDGNDRVFCSAGLSETNTMAATYAIKKSPLFTVENSACPNNEKFAFNFNIGSDNNVIPMATVISSTDVEKMILACAMFNLALQVKVSCNEKKKNGTIIRDFIIPCLANFNQSQSTQQTTSFVTKLTCTTDKDTSVKDRILSTHIYVAYFSNTGANFSHTTNCDQPKAEQILSCGFSKDFENSGFSTVAQLLMDGSSDPIVQVGEPGEKSVNIIVKKHGTYKCSVAVKYVTCAYHCSNLTSAPVAVTNSIDLPENCFKSAADDGGDKSKEDAPDFALIIGISCAVAFIIVIIVIVVAVVLIRRYRKQKQEAALKARNYRREQLEMAEKLVVVDKQREAEEQKVKSLAKRYFYRKQANELLDRKIDQMEQELIERDKGVSSANLQPGQLLHREGEVMFHLDPPKKGALPSKKTDRQMKSVSYVPGGKLAKGKASSEMSGQSQGQSSKGQAKPTSTAGASRPKSDVAPKSAKKQPSRTASHSSAGHSGDGKNKNQK